MSEIAPFINILPACLPSCLPCQPCALPPPTTYWPADARGYALLRLANATGGTVHSPGPRFGAAMAAVSPVEAVLMGGVRAMQGQGVTGLGVDSACAEAMHTQTLRAFCAGFHPHATTSPLAELLLT